MARVCKDPRHLYALFTSSKLQLRLVLKRHCKNLYFFHLRKLTMLEQSEFYALEKTLCIRQCQSYKLLLLVRLILFQVLEHTLCMVHTMMPKNKQQSSCLYFQQAAFLPVRPILFLQSFSNSRRAKSTFATFCVRQTCYFYIRCWNSWLQHNLCNTFASLKTLWFKQMLQAN